MPFTPDEQLDLLFSPSLLPSEAVDALAEKGLHLRPLSSTDYERSHLSPLADLTQAPDIGSDNWKARFELMRSLKGTYYITVVVDKQSDKILATGSLVLELKFLRGAGTIGHIEDIAVRKDAQGKKLGLHIIKSLAHISEKVGCYKSILDCSEDNKGFYEKCGFKKKEIQMVRYAEQS